MSTSNPVFSDIVQLLDTLVPTNDPNIDDAPHGAYWRNTTRDAFVGIKTDDWGVPGSLITLGQPRQSNFYLALAGQAPFDGSQLPQMPDIGADSNARHATADELAMVATWITNNCPA
jgi:hypothetical protein